MENANKWKRTDCKSERAGCLFSSARNYSDFDSELEVVNLPKQLITC